MDAIITRIRDYIRLHGLFAEGDRLLLSLSAGKDSMFLLHVISLLRDEMGIEAAIFHLNHGMRGEESDRDEAFVRAIGERHGMETHICSHDFKGGRRAGISFEEDARNVRYGLLHGIAGKNGYTVIATAHSRDDQIETVLMRIVTGTGIHGLQGILPRRGAIVRPLLAVSAGEIYAYLHGHGIEWREDASNEDPSYLRNHVRNRILPVIREKFPMADGAILSLGEVAGESISLIDGLIHERYAQVVAEEDKEAYIDAETLRHSFPLFAHVLSSVIRRKFNHHVNRNMLREIFSKYLVERANVDIYVDKSIRVEKRYRNNKSWLRLRASDAEGGAAPKWVYPIEPEAATEQVIEIEEIGISVTVKAVDHGFFEKFRKNTGYIFVTLENNNESLYIRNRREGDCIKTEKGSKKVKDLFIEKKLDNASKDRIPLLLAGNTVIACMTGFLFDIPNRIAADFLVDKNSKKVIAVIKN
ncbi:MAG TPA: tRNA lysidine(34) synthetase TilS [Spirochaetota bacterium]|nr:tRNA lysidine(34) synthetase TilS [Spirochaetota bacterium]HPC41810.1 tRNA lysidine(34) synthetase TilS [Spirochaetota bacterium]HPL16148.1 tRNA lysidine(34) synthetase TilS [Spirochaetota bacterium]HQF07531.1 tRNA lysidine(34) synthetase TilS [Spirochaetota bacterium]HQH96262.1 tRNA lysidine(34) synthetase TilS [Spirochaetota bacterium]